MDTFYWNLISPSYNSKYLPIILLINIHTLSSMFSKKKKGKRFAIRCWQIHRQYPLLAAFYTGRFPQDDAKLL